MKARGTAPKVRGLRRQRHRGMWRECPLPQGEGLCCAPPQIFFVNFWFKMGHFCSGFFVFRQKGASPTPFPKYATVQKRSGTCYGLVALVEALRRQPLDDEDGGTGRVDAEHENEAPRRIVVRLCSDQTRNIPQTHTKLTSTARSRGMGQGMSRPLSQTKFFEHNLTSAMKI